MPDALSLKKEPYWTLITAFSFDIADKTLINVQNGSFFFAKKRAVLDIDYGFVGDIERVNAKQLAEFIHQGLVPVIAPITSDGKGNLLNTNADRKSVV